ncbi:MAG: Gx transporter family protein [Peptococcia bacterium]
MNNRVHYALLISLALVLSLVEKLFPLGGLVPLPGIKLGLANIVTMIALFYFGWQAAMLITVSRCLLSSMFYGGLITLALSLAGGILAISVMAILKRGHGKWFSLIGIGIGGAAAHNLGQIIMASLLMNSGAVFYYLAVLFVAALITGTLTGMITHVLLQRLLRLGYERD